MTSCRVWTTVVSLFLVTGCQAAAQDRELLASRLRPDVLSAVQIQIDSANRAKLPGAALADKALELEARGVMGPAIIDAVRRGRGYLMVARESLGQSSTDTEIKAGAAAAEVGVPPHELALLRAAGGKRPLATPLVILSDLIAAKVAVGKAGDLVMQMLRACVPDMALQQFQKDVTADIARSADPEVAASARAKGAIGRAPKC